MQQVGSRRLLPMAIIVLFLAAAAIVVLIVLFRSRISVSPLSQGVSPQDVSSSADSAQTQAPEQTEELSAEDCMQATLTVIEGTVVLRRAADNDFSPVTRSVWVGCGDTIRTGSNGNAQLIFFNDTETTIFPNSEMTISNFMRDDDGSFLIRMEQAIGQLFHRINFADVNSTHEVLTPHGVAAVRGTAYWSIVHMDGDIDIFHCVTGAISITASETGQNEALSCPSVTVDIGANGELSTRELDLYCGDGICDEYMGETSSSCPDDC